ncbi:hypothetical protein ACSEUW_17090, partial [Pseudomonas aeruginosa]
MDALLILGGLLLMVAGYIWVIVLAFGTGLLWGYGSLFPPVALAYIGVLRIPRHSDTQPTLIRTPVPRSF